MTFAQLSILFIIAATWHGRYTDDRHIRAEHSNFYIKPVLRYRLHDTRYRYPLSNYRYSDVISGCRVRGCQIWAQSVSNWPKMGQIQGFFQIRFSTFWLTEPKCTESDLKNIPDLSNLWPI